MISLYDVKNGYTWVGDITDSEYQKFNTQNGSLSIQTKVIEVNSGQNMQASQSMWGAQMAQDEKPFGTAQDMANSRRISSFIGSHTSNLKILSLQTPNQVQMQLVDIKGTRITRSPLC